MSQHPVFRGGDQLIAWRIEQSPYYWWWRALCWAQEQEVLTERSVRGHHREDFQRVLRDFGHVRAGSDPLKSFARWWKARVRGGEERGVYLFADPMLEVRTQEIIERRQALELLMDDAYITVAVPRDVTLAYARESVDRILKRNGVSKEGRDYKDPAKSRARYHLTKRVQAESLRKAFRLYEHQLEAVTKGERVTNVELARRAGIKHQSRAKDQVMDKAARNRNLGIIVSRHLKMARDAVGRVQLGMFP